jgi:PadR family transcriptional regulator AphA
MSRLSYVLLALLSHQPATGYDLVHASDRLIRISPDPNIGQVYPELGNMEAEGLITVEIGKQQRTDKNEKRIYTITAAGRAKLREWLDEPVKAPAIRDDLLVKAHSIWLTDSPTRAADLFREHAYLHEEQAARYAALEKTMHDEHGAEIRQIHSQWFSAYATLQYNLSYERQYAAWCWWMVENLEQG